MKFNYNNMEHELLHTVMEEEDISDYSGTGRQLYQKEDDDEEPPKEKQPGKLIASLLICAAVFAGAAVALQGFSTEYAYTQTENAYHTCLTLFSAGDYTGALEQVDILLAQEEDNLEYLALKDMICENLEDVDAQIKVLKKIIELDEDNYPAYEKLLNLYLGDENQSEIAALAVQAPNAAIYSMLKEYLVDMPSFELTPGVYESRQELAISADEGLNIYYTLDGTSPKENGRIYFNPIMLEQGHITVKAVCRNENGAYGEEITGEYEIGDGESDGGIEGQPVVYPESGYYSSPQMITIDVPIGSKAYYTWQPDVELTIYNGTLYTGGISMPEGVSVLSVIIIDEYGNSSPARQVNYTYQPEYGE